MTKEDYLSDLHHAMTDADVMKIALSVVDELEQAHLDLAESRRECKRLRAECNELDQELDKLVGRLI